MDVDDDAIAKEVGDYKPGSITRIKLHNFLTYQDVEFKPGPRLNMVVGANGTGKSTILNAICLGLGGTPKILGRADDVREFIMHGKEKAVIEIELAPLQGKVTHVLRRDMDRNKGSAKGKGRGASTFWINGERSTEKQVKELVQGEYNVQIGNLCTFLPQDKVGSFSGFDAQQLLLETEKTLSQNQSHYTTHQELIKAEQDLLDEAGNVENIQEKLDKLNHEFEQLTQAKERMDDREKALAEADVLKKKQVWLQFEALRGQALELKEKKAAIKQELKTAQASMRPLEEEAEALAVQRKEMEDKYKKLDQTTQRCRKEMEKQTQKHETHDDEVENILANIRDLDTQRDKKQDDYQKALDKIEALQKLQGKFSTTLEVVQAELKEAMEKRKSVCREYDKSKNELRRSHGQFQNLESAAKDCQQKLAEMNDESARRRDRIFRQDNNLRKIHGWLDKNRGIFRRRVWGPISVEVSAKSQNASAFLEQHVPNWCWKAFVVESKEDYDKLWQEIRVNRKVPINIVTVENGRIEPFTPMYSEQKMRILKQEHGMVGYLDESFTAPEVVMQALRTLASVHKVLVGGEKTQDSLDNKGLLEYLAEPDNSQHGTPQNSVTFASKGNRSFKYSQTMSKYGAKKASVRIDDVLPARLLAPGVSERAKKDAAEKLDLVHGEIDAFRPKLQAAEKAKADLEVESQEITSKAQAAKVMVKNIMSFQLRLETAHRKKRDAEAALETDDEVEKKMLLKSLMNRVSHGITALEAHADQHEKVIKSTISSAGIGVTKSGLAGAERQAKQLLQDKKQEFSELEQRALQIQADFAQVRKKVGDKKNEAENCAPLTDENGVELPLKTVLEELQEQTLHDVEVALEDAIQQADSIVANPDVIRQYLSLKEKIEDTTADLENISGTKNGQLAGIAEKMKPWESSLAKHVAKINVLFTKYMSIMGCTGEVGLVKGKTKDTEKDDGNFKDWGIEIRVSFRENTKAVVLSARVQSGGERSVSTIMYLMALQDMMVAPFRCVDEINQGLDDRNERLVFRRIVENSARPPKNDPTDHSGQYFLITPKLLPNLYDMEVEAMTVLFVFNGPYNFKSPTEWNVDRILGSNKKRAIAVEADADEEDGENNGNVIPRKSGKKRKSS